MTTPSTMFAAQSPMSTIDQGLRGLLNRQRRDRAAKARAAAKPACPECVELRRRSAESVKNPTVTADGFARYYLSTEVSTKRPLPRHELSPMEARIWALLRRGEAKAEAEAARGPQPKVTTYCQHDKGFTLPRTQGSWA